MTEHDNVRLLRPQVTRLREAARAGPEDLPRGGGGGTSGGGMEPRIASLEAHAENLRTEVGKLAGLPVQVARLEERIANLPTKSFIVTATSAIIGAITLLTAFSEKIHALIGG